MSATANIKLTPVEISIQPNFENGSMGMDWDTLTVSPASGNAVTFAGGSAGIGLNVSGVSNAIKAESTASAGATFIGGSDRSGISVLGQGSASGVISTGGATGHALELIGGSSSGRGLHVAATSGAGVYVTSASGHGAHLHAQGASSGAGLKLSGSLTGAAFQLIAGTTSGNAIDTTVTSGNHLDPYILAEINNMTNNSLGVQQVPALGTTAVFFRAYDVDGPVESNSANITAQISMDSAASAATVDVNPGEVDSTDHPGLYYFNTWSS